MAKKQQKTAKTNLLYFAFCLHNFIIFIFRIIFGRTCYGTMVHVSHNMRPRISGYEDLAGHYTYCCGRVHGHETSLVDWTKSSQVTTGEKKTGCGKKIKLKKNTCDGMLDSQSALESVLGVAVIVQD